MLPALGRVADEVGKLALESLDRYGSQRFFAFFYFSDPDHAGHKYGENSHEYSSAIVAADEWLGRIVAKSRELGVYERTRIYVTSDHGFDEGKASHSMAPYVFLAARLVRASAVRRGGHL
ncbi:MAG: alkaline phosphatase family protein [Bacillota bacterium]